MKSEEEKMIITKVTDKYLIAVKNGDRAKEDILKKIIKKAEKLLVDRNIKVTNARESAIVKEVALEELATIEKKANGCSNDEKNLYENKLSIIREFVVAAS